MSGAEPIALIGLIGTIVDLIAKLQQVKETANSLSTADSGLRKITDSIPLMLSTLRLAQDIQERRAQQYNTTVEAAVRDSIVETTNAVQPVLVSCDRNIEALRVQITKRTISPEASMPRRYLQALVLTLGGGRSKVDSLRSAIESDFELLRTHQFFHSSVAIADSRAAGPSGSLTDHSETARGGSAASGTRATEQSRIGPFQWHNDGSTRLGSQGMHVIHGGQVVNL